jgi:hypothetical protein
MNPNYSITNTAAAVNDVSPSSEAELSLNTRPLFNVTEPVKVIKLKRNDGLYIFHKKTPYLARRSKPNPTAKADGTPGAPIPFGNWYVYQTIDGKDYRFSLRTEVYDEAKEKYNDWLKTLTVIPAEGGTLSALLPYLIKRSNKARSTDKSRAAFTYAATRLCRGCPFMFKQVKDLTDKMVGDEWDAYVDTGCQHLEDGTVTLRNYSLNTLKGEYKVLLSVIKTATKKSWLPADHTLLDDISLDDPDNSCPRCVKELTDEIFQKIRFHMYNGKGTRHPHTPIVFDVYWMSGGRKSSVANIHTEDVNFRTGWLFFRVAKGHYPLLHLPDRNRHQYPVDDHHCLHRRVVHLGPNLLHLHP